MQEPTVSGENTPVNRESRRGIGIKPGEFLPAGEVMVRLETSRKTWNKWKERGLRTIYPDTKTEYAFTDDVLAIMVAYRGD